MRQPVVRLPGPTGDRSPAEAEAGSVSVELVVFVVPVMMLLAVFVVFCGRVASARISIDAASAAGARAAAAADTPAAAVAAGASAVSASTTAGRACASMVDVSGFRPGGQVTVHVECRVTVADLGLLGVTAVRVLHSTATEPIDTHRSLP